MKKLKNTGDKLIPVFFTIGLLILWQLVILIGGIEKYILPAPSDVIKVIIKDFNVMLPNILITIYEGVVGFLLSAVAALILAIIMDMSTLVKRALYPLFVISQTIPIIALAPLFMIWFGFGTLPKIIVVVLVCFFPIVISISDGLESVDNDFINHFKLMGASRIKIFLHLKLPYGLLSFFSGMRIAATYSIMGAVVGEWLGGDKGIGVYMTRARSAYVIVVVSMGIFILISFVEKIFTPWKRLKK